MGFLSSILGGGGGSQTKSSGVSPEMKPYLYGNGSTTGLLSEAENLYNQGSQGYYPGQTYAGFDQNQTQGQNSALNFAQGGMQQNAQSAMDANRMMTSGDLLYADSNPYLQQNISDTNNLIGRDYQENVMPGIGNQAVNAGQYDSSRQGIAEGIASRGMGEAIQRNTNQMMNNAYTSGLNMMGQGVGQTNQVMAGGLAPSQVQQDVGAQRQGMAQQGINENVNRFNQEQNAGWQNLQNYQGILGGNYTGTGSTSTQPTSGSSPLGSIMGLASTGMGIYDGGVSSGLWDK